ncbi:MAG TPA: LarC family nickel insertion protein [Rhodopila sp.]|uniref:LarC family nickel insertion protein n=1 Tax=Rhodopila sp. TaxID=2480087 RepID=UPI002C359FA7|nr:LarC family nickel insertion protein [Rhodopila sp.]HVY16088.1 LarC family nickel insertion protein [Rhodopila sp.]
MPDIHLDAVGGIAGDMFVAALLDALPDLQPRVLADARAVLPPGYGVALPARRSGGLKALGFGLTGTDRQHHHHHDDHHDNSGSFADMVARIRGAALHGGTADKAIGLLTLIAEVEADIHQVPLEQVHFHEIADWDSLVDVVAAGSIAAALDGARWSVSPLPRGGGLVKTHHGLLPVPAPATAALLTGFTWRDDGVTGERVTPTGAAILRFLADPGGSSTEGRLVASGSGAGTRVLPGLPNILRALVFEPTEAASGDEVGVLGFEVDDMTGEEIAVAADRLRAVPGVLDLTIGQVQGKKGRPMQSFRLLVRPGHQDAVVARCFLETSTIGLRVSRERRVVLPRRLARVAAGSASVGVKTVERGGARSTKAEADDLAGDSLDARRRMKRLAEDAV